MKDVIRLIHSRSELVWETEAAKQEYIDSLEGFLEKCNQEARDGNPSVDDAVYDSCMDILRNVKPDSYLLHQVWSADDDTVPFDSNLDQFLIKYPMLSIQTVKNMFDKPIKDFRDKLIFPVEVICSVKENGHGVRIIYLNGKLEKATSRGRSTNGRDLTRQMRVLLGSNNSALGDMGVVEVRAEVVLPFSNLDKARRFNSTIKSAFSGVSSMIRESATNEEVSLLKVVAYDILSNNSEFSTLSQKLEFLMNSGFYVPEHFTRSVSKKNFDKEIDDIISTMDMMCSDYDHHTDGVVLAIDDLEFFSEFGAEDKFRLGNLALKMGRWKQDNYAGIVGRIEWVEGKSKKTPVAILEEGVITASGNTVTNVPLYAPCYILMLEAYPGNIVHFKYGGEAGVVPVTRDGKLITGREE